MQLPNWAKATWWIVLVAGITFFLYERLPDLLTGKAAAADIAVFGVWMALLLAPLFSEVTLLGVTLKQEIEELKGHVSAQLNEVRTDLRNAVDVRTNFSPTFNIPVAPPDTQLPEIEERVKSAVASAFAEYGTGMTANSDIPISEDVRYLFATRFHIESQLRRLAAAREVSMLPRRPMPTHLLSRSLVDSGRISPPLASAIREVYSVCSPAVHGEPVTDAQISFVRDVGPELIRALRAIPE